MYQEDYGIAESITIYPGGSNSDYSPLEKDEIYISLDWYSKEKDDKDYAVITVTEKAGAGHWGTMYYGKNASLLEESVYRLGFPTDKSSGSLWKSGAKKIGSATTNLFYHEGYVVSGESGGPVISTETSYILGIQIGVHDVQGDAPPQPCRRRTFSAP